MTDHPERRQADRDAHAELSSQALALNRSVDALAEAVKELRTSQERVKIAVVGTVAGLVVTLILYVVVAFVAIEARSAGNNAADAQAVAASNAENQRITCETGNEARVAQVRLWTYVLDIADNNPELTPLERTQLRQFRAYVSTVFAPRNCDGTGRPTVITPSPVPTR